MDAIHFKCNYVMALSRCGIVWALLWAHARCAEPRASDEESQSVVSAGGLSWPAGAGLHPVFPLEIPEGRDVSTARCTGPDSDTRTCRVYNMCFDSTGPVQSQDGTFVLYTGSDSTTLQIDIEGAGTAGFSGGVLAFKGSLRTDAPVRLSPVVRPGRVPAAQVAKWVDTPLVMLGRHWPSNWAHAVCDDYFPLWRE